VGHHDDAYDWAERRKLEVHPRTGAAQMVEVRELVREVEVPVYVEAAAPARGAPPLFERASHDQDHPSPPSSPRSRNAFNPCLARTA
jgi:hypothetical protein